VGKNFAVLNIFFQGIFIETPLHKAKFKSLGASIKGIGGPLTD
jgi:hypothetical protein